MTDENKDEEIKLTPAEDNPWYWLMQTTTALDKGKTPNGWHWFVALHCILKFDFKREQANLPDTHPLKSESLKLNTTKETLKDIVIEFKEDLKLANIDIINFTALDFLEETDFSNFIFPIPVSFGHSKFHKSVNFTLASFYLTSIFSEAIFSDDVRFNKTKFYSELTFQHTKFFKEVYFIKAKFLAGTIFNHAEFFNVSGCAHFTDAIFSNVTFFNNTKFYGKVYFHNAKFLKYTTFAETQFENYAPQFYGAEINDEMTWTGIKLPRFKKSYDKETSKNYKKRIESNQNAYENLSTKLDNQKKYHDQHLFFRAETRCRQELAESFFSFCAFWLYELFSDYGYRIGRAVWCWFGHMVFWAGILFFFGFKDTATTSQKIACSALTSVSNAHSFLLSKGERLDDCYEMASNKTIFNLFWAGETILGVAFLFLVLLTLRTRFRIK